MSLIKKIVRAFADTPTSNNEATGKPEKQEDSADRSNGPARNSADRPSDDRPRKRRNRNRRRKKPDRNQNESSQGHRPTRQPKPKPPPTKTAVDPSGFKNFGLRDEILRAVGEQGYENPTPIQKASIADLVKGRDLLGCAQTGTGKTAAFALPTLHRLSQDKPSRRAIRVLVLAPTRELALQVSESFNQYGRYLDLSCAVIFGGVGAEPQKRALKRGIDILVATPGRLLDLHNQGFVHFDRLEILVLDEADRMLDMGFLPDVKRILKLLPKNRQNILFSATMPRDIQDLSMQLLKDPVKVEVAPVSSTSDQVDQTVYFVAQLNKRKLVLHLLKDPTTKKVLIFSRTKSVANRITKYLNDNSIDALAIHGNKSQNARQKALESFREGTTRVLVASDLAARGIDIDDISHVINYDLPNISETYVHRIGRTGRASAVGKAISFCNSEEERGYLKGIERLIGKRVPVVDDHPFLPSPDDPVQPPAPQRGPRGRGRNQGRGRGKSRSRGRR